MAEDTYDAYVSHAPADRRWAPRLAEDLSAFGLRCFWDASRAGDVLSAGLRDSLDASRALVVI